MGRYLRAVPRQERRVQLRRARHRERGGGLAGEPEDRGGGERHVGGRGHPRRESEGSVHRPQHPDHRQRHPHHRERADGSDGGGGEYHGPCNILLQHDGSPRRGTHRQLRGDRRHPLDASVAARVSRSGHEVTSRPRTLLAVGALLAALAARDQPVDMVFYDNQKDGTKAIANVADAVQRRVDLYIRYFPDPAVNQDVSAMLRKAGIPALAVNYPMPGAPLYGVDNAAAGQIAGEALARFASRGWAGQAMVAVLLGNLTGQTSGLPERVRGVRASLTRLLPGARLVALDTRGNPAQVSPLLGKVAAASPNTRLLIAALDDATALAAKSALEALGRTA